MVIVSYFLLSDSSWFSALLIDRSRTQPVEDISPPRRAQRTLYDQDLHHSRAEAAGLPCAEPQWHDTRH